MTRPVKSELTERDWSIVQHLADGWQSVEIAKEFGMTDASFKVHLSRMFDTAGVWNRVELVAKGFREHRVI